ncbi:MAG TPA: hypothetical protein ENJ88_06520, partial [Phaeodactylibacter sp.]|nr:hypothetical protein [Phaeodactylibacter sp.]
MQKLRKIIENAWEHRELLEVIEVRDAVREVIALLDAGKLRVAEPLPSGEDGALSWQVHE